MTKTVSLTPEQIEWINKQPLNFSKWVRIKLTEEMKDGKKYE